MLYYSDSNYVIDKKGDWFLIVPAYVNGNLSYVDYIDKMNIFDLSKLAKKDIIYYFEQINKAVKEINKLGLQQLPEIQLEELRNAEKNNDSKKFMDILNKSKDQVKKISNGLNTCNNKGATINKMFDVIVSKVYDEEFLKWIKVNYNLCYSCDNFEQVERIYKEQKEKVRDVIMNDDKNEKDIKLNEVKSMPSNGIENLPSFVQMPVQEHNSEMTLEDVGLKPAELDINTVDVSNDTFKMDTTPKHDDMDTTLYINKEHQQQASQEQNLEQDMEQNLENTNIKVRRLVPPNNSNMGHVNWYGIILTLIFSFAVGYLIAWILLKIR